MNFVKSSLGKKLIIVLIALMIFNVAMPAQVNAGVLDAVIDAGAGILFLPLKALLLTITNNINITLGRFLRGVGGTVDNVVDSVMEAVNKGKDYNNALKQVADGMTAAVSSIFIGPEDIFSGNIDILNANVFKTVGKGALGTLVSFVWQDLNPGASIGNQVRATVANIFVLLRNICALIMLAGLIYTGIRILVTSNTPSKKMQYLMLLEDWVMGMVLLIFSHVFMILIFELAEAFVKILSTGLTGGSSKLTFTLFWNAFKSLGFNAALTNTILYGYMTWLTFVFTISYFKRFFWIVVLTVFAPVVSIMYAFGQQTKQIYSRWLKEYIMTVFLQPFHMLVYYVLVMIPLKLAGGGVFGFSENSGLFTLIYALVAISFIRPAEKFLRELFGFDKGIAGMGSYDSGANTITAAAKAAAAIGSVAADVVAPGTGQAIRSGLSAMESMDQSGSETAPVITTATDEDDYNSVDAATDAANAEIAAESNETDALGEGDEMGGVNLSSLYGKKGAINKKIKAIENSVDWNFAAHELNGMESPYTDEQEAEMEKLRDERAGIEEQIKAGKAAKQDKALGSGNGDGASGGGNKLGGKGNEAINVSNLTINASNIDIKGSGAGDLAAKAIGKGDPIEKVEGKPDEKDMAQGNSNENIDGDIDITDGEDKQKRSPWDYITGKAAAQQLGALNDMKTGKRSIVDGIASPYEWLGQKFTGNSFGRKVADGGLKIKDFAKKFEEAGGITELYKGFNSVRDTMYVNGAPGDWQSTAAQMDENKKKRDEKAIYNFSHNEGNKNFMLSAKGDNLLAKYQEIYKDKSPEYQRHMAEQEAEKKLESMAKAFVPHGITDVTVAHSLKNDQKKYGYSAEEAIRQANKFNKFNTSQANISVVNNTYGKNTNTPVSAKIPDANYYFNNGITDISTMIQADRIAVKLGQQLGDRISDQMKKEVATAVAKNGSASYTGSNSDIRKIIDDITKRGK